MQGNLREMSLIQILFSFKGRINRGTFWVASFSAGAVFLIVVLLTFGISSSAGEGDADPAIIFLIYLIPMEWIILAMQVKRWHDRNKSGWMVLIRFIPILGGLWTLIELGFLPGTIGTNKYGDDPL